MTGDMEWPVDLIPQEDGAVLVKFPDVPEALTDGDNEDDALEQAKDCLATALAGYIDNKEPVPCPSLAGGRRTVKLPMAAAVRIADHWQHDRESAQ